VSKFGRMSSLLGFARDRQRGDDGAEMAAAEKAFLGRARNLQ
jgi:hypothetical protein